ncbi:hypothetical protein [Bilifractor sp. HCP3S3_D3]|uniref:hypothetical protein n=1 Tax=Bilifractor sp. HCP3S3_D3 TaxID=3438907 RepID=UPI003F8A5322
MDNNQVPLSVMMENANGKLTAAFSQIAQETHLPAYLLEGIVAGILSDIRKQKNIELAADYAAMNKADKADNTESEEKTDG